MVETQAGFCEQKLNPCMMIWDDQKEEVIDRLPNGNQNISMIWLYFIWLLFLQN